MPHRLHRPDIVLMCPTFVTGGPEAIHQAAMAFREAGWRAEIAYYGDGYAHTRTGDGIEISGPETNVCLKAFAAYRPVAARVVPLDAQTLVVLPEVLAGAIETFRPARVALWWLSVDNALASLPALHREADRHALFDRSDVEHWVQSDYAKRFLLANGAKTARRLTDFTDRAFTAQVPTGPNPGRTILYNRRKGADLAARFFAANPDLEPRPLDGLDRPALVAAYRAAPLYVDFGSLPGKDRMPREAAACGCTIFVHDVGAGHEMGDFAMSDIFRFSDAEAEGGQLAAKLRMALDHPRAVWDLQSVLRSEIRQERAAFFQEAAAIAASYRRAAIAGVRRRVA